MMKWPHLDFLGELQQPFTRLCLEPRAGLVCGLGARIHGLIAWYCAARHNMLLPYQRR